MAENITSSTQEPVEKPSTDSTFLAAGGEMGKRIRTCDWLNSPVGEPGAWSTSLRTLLHMMLTSRFPMLLFWGQELTTFYNDAFRPGLGTSGKHPAALGQPGKQSWAESWPTIGPVIDRVMKGGEAVWVEDQQLPLFGDGQAGYADWTYSFSPVINDTGVVNGVLVTCSEMTKAVERVEQLKATNHGLEELLEQNSALRQEEQAAQEQLRDSQRQLLRSFEQVPVGIAILSADRLIFRNANPFYGQLVGRSPGQLVGKPFLEALPELAGQGFDGRLREVVETGKPFIAKEVAVDIARENGLETIYVDLTYQPQWESSGEVSSVLVVATNVTQQVQSRRAVEESESLLRSVVESAPFPIGVYIGPQMRILLANKSIIGVFGKGDDVVGKSYKEILPELDNQQIFEQITGVLTTGIPYHARYQRVDIVVDGRLQPYYFNYSFTPLFNAEGQVYGVMNTAAEVTDLVIARQKVEESELRYRHLSRDLDLQVQQRTEELAATNEELMATNEELANVNEELAASNEELIESNDLLIQSNDNLEKFAYIASHDLQEPLRKIQQFGDLLKSRYTDSTGEERIYVDRMQSAASRMSILIKDLLRFSRIATQRDTRRLISLDEILSRVINTLELTIQETGAQLEVDVLPTVLGDASQLDQLFQNLLSNALKFRRAGVVPRIVIRSSLVAASDLPAEVKPVPLVTQYYQIDVVDNGIGFDEKYLTRIFQVFQRLHTKDQYAGTGIGLAICEKVVVNHGGALTASSQPGQGATFSVYLPV